MAKKIEMMVRQATIEEQPMIYNFERTGYVFVVKNLTEGNVYIGFPGNQKEESILIPGETAQILPIGPSTNIQIIPDATSEEGVEVQCIRY